MVLVVGGVSLIIWQLYRQQLALYHSMALQGTAIQVESIKAFRQMYSTEVAARARALGIEVVHDYEGKAHALPLPATLTIKLGEAINQARPGAWVRLYSDYPFPWRKETGGVRDAFGAEALRQLRQHPDQPFYRFEDFQGRPSLRYAVADRMQASCVACHNSHPDSPKTDWKEGDVRGVLEFIRPLDNHGEAAVARSRAGLWWTFGGTVAMFGVGLVGLGLAVRGNRRASASLRQSEERFRMLSSSAPIGIFETDAAGANLYTNPQWEKISGLAAADTAGQGWERIIHPEDAAEVFAGWRAAAARGLEFDREFRLLTTTGEVRWVHSRSAPMRSEAGGLIGHVGTVEDITERKRAEAELEKANRELLEVSRQAGRAEVATGVLHNVGNVLNSVNVTSTCLADSLRKSKAGSLAKVAALMREHEADLGSFFGSDPKGKQLPGYLAQLSEHLAGEQAAALKELADLQKNIEHIKEIVTMQQSYARKFGVMETLPVSELVEDALRMNASALVRHEVQVIKEFEAAPPVTVDKHKVLQILVNLVRNAKYACDEAGQPDKRLWMRVTKGDDRVRIAVTDNGVGIPTENLTRIFAHGFTTKKDGHGFGLHSGALAAKELGGSLTAHSDGVGRGATFTLELPLESEKRLPCPIENKTEPAYPVPMRASG
jgi:PAS domain S-box-containing protein